MVSRQMANKRGQSIIEYLIVAAALILAFATFGTAMGTGVNNVGTNSQTAISTGGDSIGRLNPGQE